MPTTNPFRSNTPAKSADPWPSISPAIKLFEVTVALESGHSLNVLMAESTPEGAIRAVRHTLKANGVKGRGEALGHFAYDPEGMKAAEVELKVV
jgi:hypothetical protein